MQNVSFNLGSECASKTSKLESHSETTISTVQRVLIHFL